MWNESFELVNLYRGETTIALLRPQIYILKESLTIFRHPVVLYANIPIIMAISKTTTTNGRTAKIQKRPRKWWLTNVNTRKVVRLVSFLLHTFKLFLEDMSPICGATDAPLLVTRSPLWVSKSLCITCVQWVLQLHLWCDTCRPRMAVRDLHTHNLYFKFLLQLFITFKLN